jgi:hypothetical protein
MHRVYFIVFLALSCIGMMTIGSAANFRTVQQTHGGPVVRNVRLAIEGPAQVRVGQDIPIDVSVQSMITGPVFITYGSLDLVKFRVIDAGGHPVEPRDAMVVIMLRRYLVGEDKTTLSLQQYAHIQRPGTYTVTAQLAVAFTAGTHGPVLQQTTLSSNPITITVTP